MAIVKIKLTKKVNNVVNDYYPKTSADNVVYDSNNTVADKLNAIETTLTFDSSPTENSDNLVKSGVIYTALVGKADAQATQTALNSKADATATQTALAEKQNALTAGANIAIETVNDVLTISATDTTYSAATTSAPGLMSAADKAKLDGISATAEVNVQADWNQTNSEADDYIQNKPDLSVYAESAAVTTALSVKVDKETGKSLMTADEHTKLSGIETGAQVNTVTGVKGSNEAEYRTGNVSITKGNVGLGNVDNTADTDKPISTAAQTALDGKVDKETGKVLTDINYSATEKAKVDGAIQSTEKGSSGGVAELDANGKVPSSQLPSFVDDVMEYADVAHFPQAGESGKIYITVDTNLSYRWTGTGYAEISPSLALGETSSTAYRGDWGKATKDAVGNIQTLQTDDKSNLVAAINELKSTSVSADPNKGLSSNDFTTALKNKLDGIATGAEVNVQSDWNQSDTTADDFIKNKPTNASASAAGLMSAADFKKINAQPIAANSNLNDIKGEGWYFCVSNNTVATFSNCPTYNAFYLEVHKHAGTYQHIVEYSTTGAKHFHRNFYSNVWGNWVEWKLTDTTYSNATPSTNGVGGSAGLMSAADKAKLDGMTAVLNAEILFDSPSGAIVTNASPSITFDTGKSVSGITNGYLEVLFKQNNGTNGGVNSARALIHTVSGSVVVEPVQLLGWEYDSANSALALTGCAGTVSNGSTLTFSNPESAAFSFTVYRIVGYKAVTAA